MKQNQTKGFTLIELLVVVLIIGILSAVALPQYEKTVEKARITQLVTYVNGLSAAASVYYLANGVYPLDVRDLDVDITMNGKVEKSALTTSDAMGIIFPKEIECVSSLGGALCLDRRSGVGILRRHSDGKSVSPLLCGNYGHKDGAEGVCKSIGKFHSMNEGRNFYSF